jgi:hypothetical protein
VQAVGYQWVPAGAHVKRRRRQWPAFLPLFLPILVLAAFAAYYLLTPPKSKVIEPPPGHVHSLVWGNGIFATDHQLAPWLHARGANYRGWAKLHPAGVKLIKPAAKHKRPKH